MQRLFRIYVVPGAVIQSVMIGGGYGTGREIVEFFTSYGGVGGLLGIGVAYVVLALVLATTFEFARAFAVYDYRLFFKRLLGRGWIAFEVLVILLFLLVLAVLASAAGNVLQDHFDIPHLAGIAVMLSVVGVLTFYGRTLVTLVLTYWSLVLYAVFIAFLVAVFGRDDVSLSDAFRDTDIRPGWWLSGFRYASYNIAVVPILLYVARGFETRGEALRSGAIAGVIALVPALIFQVAFATAAPEILSEAIPVYWMIDRLELTTLAVVYAVMLFGTLIETGAGVLQGINDRIDGYLLEIRNSGLSNAARSMVAVSAILVSSALSLWGITSLIAKGYGTMAWGFVVVYVIPLMSFGVYQLMKKKAAR